MGAPTTSPSREELKGAVDELVDEIVNGSDEHWQRYATRLSHERALGAQLGMFKPWSVNNMFYLHAQVRGRKASVKGLFAGVDQWRKRGRSVRQGEKPYAIYGPPSFLVKPKTTAAPAAAQPAPVTPSGPLPPAAASAPASPSPAQPVRMFRRPPVIEVFDWTQTVADDPDYVEPDWGVPLAAGDLGTLRLLVLTAPVPVRFTDLAAKNEHGWLDATGITVDGTMGVGNRIFTTVHELAHHYLGHLDRLSSTATPAEQETEEFSAYAVCEQEAALAQFLAMKMLGLDEAAGNDLTQAAGAYLRSWLRTDADGKTVPVEGHRTKRKLVLKRFDAAFKAADQIVAAFLAARAAEDAAQAATPAATGAAPGQTQQPTAPAVRELAGAGA